MAAALPKQLKLRPDPHLFFQLCCRVISLSPNVIICWFGQKFTILFLLINYSKLYNLKKTLWDFGDFISVAVISYINYISYSSSQYHFRFIHLQNTDLKKEKKKKKDWLIFLIKDTENNQVNA